MLAPEEAAIRAVETRIALLVIHERYDVPAFDYRRARPYEVTCEDCGVNDTCDLAFDPYNTDGDCLAIK